MLAQFGIEASRAAQYVVAFAIILVLVALFGVVLRKLTGARLMMPSQDRGRSRQPRLGIVDIYDLDRQRQLVLLRRDNVEHLLLIGGLNDVVIETNIVRAAGARIPAPSVEPGAERFEPAIEQAPRPQVEGGLRPSIETQLAAQLGSFGRRPSEESDMDQELAPVATVSAPLPARPEPILKPDAVTLATPVPAEAPALNVRGLRAEAKGPTVSSFPPAPAPEGRRSEPMPAPSPSVFPLRPTQPPAPPPAPTPVEPPMNRSAQPGPADRQAPDAAILSDMARQLEEALRRPAGMAPAPTAPVAGPHHVDIEDEDELLEPNAPVQAPGAAPFQEEPEEEPQQEPERPVAATPVRPVEPVRPVPPPPSPVPAQPAPEAAGPARPAEKPADPFSVDEIEAEFARLLGRPLDSGKKE